MVPVIGTMRVATANVLTLAPVEWRQASEAGLAIPGRVAQLERDFEENGVQVVGVQEARVDGPFQRDGEHYRIFAGPAPGGRLGCQVWIQRAFLAGASATFEPCGPRAVALYVEAPGSRYCYVSCHAPHGAMDDASRNAFYEELAGICRRARRGSWAIVLLGDFNATMGSEPSWTFGAAFKDQETAPGRSLREFLEAEGLFVVNSQPGLVVPSYLGFGDERFYDLVVSDPDTPRRCTGAKALDVELNTSSKLDHVAVAVDIPYTAGKRRGGAAPRRRALDRRLATPAAMAAVLAEATAAMGAVTAPLNVDEHAAVLQGAVAAAAHRRLAAPVATRPRKPWISEATWGLMQRAKAARRHSLAFRRRARQRRAHSNGGGHWSQGVTEDSAAAAWGATAARWQRAYRAAIRDDRAAFLEELADEAERASARGDAAALYRLVNRAAGPGRRPPARRRAASRSGS